MKAHIRRKNFNTKKLRNFSYNRLEQKFIHLYECKEKQAGKNREVEKKRATYQDYEVAFRVWAALLFQQITSNTRTHCTFQTGTNL